MPIPFIWGPVGGGESAPKPFWQDFSLRAKLYELARNLVRGLGERDPFVHQTAKKSAVVRATTQDTADRLQRIGASKIQIVPEVGLPEDEINFLAQYQLPQANPMRFISMGRLLHWKGFHLGLKAFAQAGLLDAEYWIVGDGPERANLEKIAGEYGIADRVKFWGRLSREETLQKLEQCHVLVHPSLHDSGGWVCIEAMAAARPVICLNLGGPAVQVTDHTGFKIPAHNPAQAVKDIAAAMIRLEREPELRANMGRAGRQIVHDNYSWKVVGECLGSVYRDTVKSAS